MANAEVTANIKITGMKCAMCSTAIQTAIGEMKGVGSANVDLGREMASVKFDPSLVDMKKIEDTVKEVGYGVINERTSLKIGGMTCAVCSMAIKTALEELPGIVEVNVNLGTERAKVEYVPNLVGIEEMKDKIEEVGYSYLGRATYSGQDAAGTG